MSTVYGITHKSQKYQLIKITENLTAKIPLKTVSVFPNHRTKAVGLTGQVTKGTKIINFLFSPKSNGY